MLGRPRRPALRRCVQLHEAASCSTSGCPRSSGPRLCKHFIRPTPASGLPRHLHRGEIASMEAVPGRVGQWFPYLLTPGRSCASPLFCHQGAKLPCACTSTYDLIVGGRTTKPYGPNTETVRKRPGSSSTAPGPQFVFDPFRWRSLLPAAPLSRWRHRGSHIYSTCVNSFILIIS
jgi:hypothetical protein